MFPLCAEIDIIRPSAACVIGAFMYGNQIVVGETIKAARKRKGISASNLGKMLEPNVSATAIYKWENDRTEPNINHLKQLSLLLDIDLGNVFDINGENDEISTYMKLMSENQRSAVLGVARAMVNC